MPGHRKRLAGNFISLSLVQGLSILFPLITFPYLIRVLGVEGFGVFTLIQTFIIYFDMLVSFGFGLTATQRIAKHVNESEEINRIISAVYIIKFILFIFSVIVFLACCIFIPYLQDNFLIVLVSSLYLLGNLLFPDWYFQGIQKMRSITIVAIVSKVISLLLIILLVRKSTDILYAVLAMCAGNFIAGLLGYSILRRSIKFKIVFPAREYIISFFKESGYVFTSIILAPLYASINLFILQVFTNPLMVGYYAIAEKIFSAIGMLTSIANRTFYPHLSQLYITSIEAYKKNIRSILMLFLFSFTVFALVQFFGAEYIVRIVAGKKQVDISYAVDILRIMSFGLLFSPYVSFFFQLMILQGQRKQAVRNILATVIINLFTASLFAYFYSGKGMAINLCVILMIISTLNFSGFYKKLKSIQ
ncbi:MAG: oligosaccharide flippase family protein [Ferruginibacter sp.]